MAALRSRVQHSPVRGESSLPLDLSMDGLTLEECNHYEEQSADRFDGGHLVNLSRTPSPPVSVIGSPAAVFSDYAIAVPAPPAMPSPKPIVWPAASTRGADDDERAGSCDASAIGDGFCAAQARPRWRDRRNRRRRRADGPSTATGRLSSQEKLATIRKRRPPLLVIPTKYDVSLSVAKERRQPPWELVVQAPPSQVGQESEHQRGHSNALAVAATLCCA